jgi:hypothetical protein
MAKFTKADTEKRERFVLQFLKEHPRSGLLSVNQAMTEAGFSHGISTERFKALKLRRAAGAKPLPMDVLLLESEPAEPFTVIQKARAFDMLITSWGHATLVDGTERAAGTLASRAAMALHIATTFDEREFGDLMQYLERGARP